MDQSSDAPPLQANLSTIKVDHGLSDGCALMLYEAACVCFASQDHDELAALDVIGDSDVVVHIAYDDPDELVLRNHRDENMATEDGACAVAILLCRLLKGHAVVEQAEQLDGVDYWVGESQPGRPMNRKARLEATGIRQGDRSAVMKRFREKRATTSKSDGALPAIIAVVEFSAPLARMETRS